VKILLDECLPRYLKRALTGHDVRTIQEMGWAGRKNGELLALAEPAFEVFLTSDQNLRYQQNLAGRKIAILELPTNTLSVLKALQPEILLTISTIRSGDYLQIQKSSAP
jgi:predicted nuclease of predicted toxin-antitoxin system